MNERLPSPLVVYLTYLMVLVLQGPASAFLQHHTIWIGILVSQLGAIALPTALLVRWRRYDWRALFPLQRPTVVISIAVIVVTIALAMLTNAGVEWMKLHFHTPPLLEDRLPELVTFATPAEAALKFLLIALVPAVIEEGFFRGFCQGALGRAYGVRLGWLVSAFLFAAAHNSVAYLHFYLLLGLYLGALRIYGRSLWLPILAHAVNNGWTLVMKGM